MKTFKSQQKKLSFYAKPLQSEPFLWISVVLSK